MSEAGSGPSSAGPPHEVESADFIMLSRLRKRVAGMSREEFVRRFPDPALLVGAPDDDALDDVSGAEASGQGFQLLTVKIEGAGVLRYLNKVAFVRKRPGNPFAHLISVGRSGSNDIILAVESVSKVHGYFVAGDDGWSFTDHSSTNGSALNGKPLDASRNYSLSDGDMLRLGLEVQVEFLGPEALHQKLSS